MQRTRNNVDTNVENYKVEDLMHFKKSSSRIFNVKAVNITMSSINSATKCK